MYAERYRIVDVEITVEGPPELLPIVADAYRRFPQAVGRTSHAVVRIVNDEGNLSIRIGEREYTSVSAAAGHGRLSLEISNAVITAVAQRSRFLIVHAAALERGGESLCIAGKGMSGKTLLASHLVARGWKILSDEYAFVEPLSGHVVPFPKLLFVRSSSLPHMPRSFRKSVEFSQWYGLGDRPGIVFSGVDPSHSYSEDVWSTGARLTHLLIMGERGRVPSVEPTQAWAVIPDLNTLVWQPPDLLEGLTRLATALRGVRVARLTGADPVHTTNAIERWAGARKGVALSA